MNQIIQLRGHMKLSNERQETGPMRASEDDWMGVFIRGDNAWGWARDLTVALATSNLDAYTKERVVKLRDLLDSCQEHPPERATTSYAVIADFCGENCGHDHVVPGQTPIPVCEMCDGAGEIKVCCDGIECGCQGYREPCPECSPDTKLCEPWGDVDEMQECALDALAPKEQ